MSERYKVGDSSRPHHITLTIIDWVDVFVRPVYKDIIIDSLQYCQNHKGLIVHAFCIMTSHVHLIVSSSKNPLNEIVRDMKKFTTKKLIEALNAEHESRRYWMLKKFQFAAERIKRVNEFKVWKDGFHPVELDTNEMMDQRLEYVHQNPVEAGIVYSAEDYVYSSAAYYAGGECLINILMIQ
jgi:REP element-mobilizing transposase RayT